MSEIEFFNWISDWLNVQNPDIKELNAAQTKLLKERLSSVFHKVTPEVKLESPSTKWFGDWFGDKKCNSFGMDPNNKVEFPMPVRIDVTC